MGCPVLLTIRQDATADVAGYVPQTLLFAEMFVLMYAIWKIQKILAF